MADNKLGLCAELLQTAEAAYVTTIDAHGFPETRAMFNLRRAVEYPALITLFKQHDDDLLVYFTTNTSSRKIAQLRANRKASVYYSQPEQRKGLNLTGLLEIVDDMNLKNVLWQEGWERYYPQGPTDPDYTVLRMRPQSARYYHRLQIFEMDFPPSE